MKKEPEIIETSTAAEPNNGAAAAGQTSSAFNDKTGAAAACPTGTDLSGCASTEPETGPQLILYDGVCGLCNKFVKTVLDRDPHEKFQFASLQSELGRSILTTMGKDPSQLNTIYLVKHYGRPSQTVLSKARAALDIFSQLEGPIRLLKIFTFLPAWVLNLGYDLVAANRYHIFGRLDTCPLPNPAHIKRFLDQ